MDVNNVAAGFTSHVALWVAAVVAFLIVLRIANIFRYIPNNQVGIVEKMWSPKGSIKGFIALHGEAGFEPEILRGGIHIFVPFTYRIHKSDLVTVGQGRIAYVFARDGAPLGASQVLGVERHRRQVGFPGCAPLPDRWRPEGPAAQDPARRHLCDQHDAVRRHHGRARLWPRAEPAGTAACSTACSRPSPIATASRR